MLSIFYPANLPGVSSFNGQPLSTVLSDDGDGVKQFRRRSSVASNNVQVTFVFLETDLSIFLEWGKSVLLNWHRWFWIKFPSAAGIVWHLIRFVKKPAISIKGHTHWSADCEIETRERRIKDLAVFDWEIIHDFVDDAKYLDVPNTDDVNRSALSYDDSSWSEGPGPYGNGGHHPAYPLSTIDPNTAGVYPFLTRFWTRWKATVEYPSTLKITVWADDLPKLYLNGNLVSLIPYNAVSGYYTSSEIVGEICIAIRVEDLLSVNTYSAFRAERLVSQ